MARRDTLRNLTRHQAHHPGLWLDRYLNVAADATKKDRQAQHRTHVADTAAIAPPSAYPHAYDRWRTTLQTLGANTAIVRTPYRIAVGHGRESVIETGLTLHHTYGVPYIPGSSLKGAAAAFAAAQLDNQWQPGSDAFNTLFGTTTSAGYVTFLDALPVPNTWQLLPDVLTVHHTGYYRGQGDPPADWDDPTPIPFLSATGDFLVAVLPQANAAAWATTALELLRMALAESGVGGKTSSGYGRLR